MKPLALSFFLFCFSISVFSAQTGGVWDVYQFGAKGDGKTLDTKAIQAAVDQCHEKGGGKVYLHNGTFVSGTIILKSNVTFYVEAGTVLRCSNNLDDFPIMSSKYPSYMGDFVTNKMLLYAEDAQNISICGRGTIDGNGDYWVDGPYLNPSFSGRPRIIHFRGCKNIHIKDITLYNSASWVQSYQSCSNMVISGITVDSRENKDIEKERFTNVRGRNCDGLDLIDCKDVRVSDCMINSGDDAIVLKSLSPDESCSNIVITNCVITSNASGIKIGTETAGIMEDITVQNCVIYDTRVDGISIMTVDGARISRINISNITMRNIKTSAIFIRLGNRFRPYRKNIDLGKPVLKDIIIENIQGTRISAGYGSSITGLESIPLENITLRNIDLTFEGGGKAEDADKMVPENEKGYPCGLTLGELPAYGFYIRHVHNLVMDNIRLSFVEEDRRPAIICDDVSYSEIKGLKAMGSKQSSGLLRLVNTTDAIISESYPMSPIAVFADIQGVSSTNIYLLNNRIQDVERKYITSKGATASAVKESGSF